MIRTFRAAVAIEWKSSRKRHWTVSISRTTSSRATAPTAASFASSSPASMSPDRNVRVRQPSPNRHSSVPSRRYCVAGVRYVSRGKRRSEMSFFSTDSKPETDPESSEPSDTRNQPNQPSIGEQLKSIPNIITLSRLACTPLLCYWVVNDEPYLAIGGCLLAGVSDVLDGYIAKNHGQKTVLGTYLDPFADKFFINSLAASLWYSGILPAPLVGLWATKDALLLGGMGWYLYREQRTINFFSNSIHTRPLTVTPSAMGKANTGLQFATLAVGILTPVAAVVPPALLEALCWVTGASSVVTTLSYAGGQTGFRYSSSPSPPSNDHQSALGEESKSPGTEKDDTRA